MITFEEIRERILGPGEDARFLAWVEIYTSQDPHAPAELEKVFGGTDPLIKISFARFLSRYPQARAIQYLVRLLEDKNRVVHEAAKKAFERNGFEDRFRFLLPLVASPRRPAQYYAIEKLSQALIVDACPRFAKMLAGSDEKLLIHLLKALRYFSDERIYPYIQPYLKDEREEVRFRAVLCLGSLYEGGMRQVRRPYLDRLKDNAPAVRRAVLWGLNRKPDRRDVPLLAAISREDPDPLVRQEALRELLFFPSYKVIRYLLSLLGTEQEALVRLKIEGILYSFPERVFTKNLWKILKREKGAVQAKATLLLAEQKTGSTPLADRLIRKLERSQDPKERLLVIEALGVAAAPAAIPTLEKQLRADPLTGYAAIQALLKIWSRFPQAVHVARYLGDEQLTPLFRQTVLKELLKQPQKVQAGSALTTVLLKLLEDDNLNIRYLSAQVLAPHTDEEILGKMAEEILTEEDPAFQKFLRENLQAQLSQHPKWIGDLVAKYQKDPKAVLLFFNVIREAPIFGERLILLLRSLMEPPLQLHQGEPKELFRDLVGAFLVQHKLELKPFCEAIETIPGRDEILYLLAKALSKAPDLAQGVPIDLLKSWYEGETEQGKEAIVDLLSLGGEAGGLRFLTTLVCTEQEKKMGAYAAKAVGRYL